MPEIVEIPIELTRFQLPQAVQARLQFLLDRQDEGYALSQAERQEAEGLVELAEFLNSPTQINVTVSRMMKSLKVFHTLVPERSRRTPYTPHPPLTSDFYLSPGTYPCCVCDRNG